MVKWEDPPPRRPNFVVRGRWQEEARDLKNHPGVWGVVAEFTSRQSGYDLASNIKLARIASFRPRGSFDAVARTVGETTRVYARYTGKGRENDKEEKV